MRSKPGRWLQSHIRTTYVIKEIIAIMVMISLITIINMLFVTICIISQLYVDVYLSFRFQHFLFQHLLLLKELKPN